MADLKESQAGSDPDDSVSSTHSQRSGLIGRTLAAAIFALLALLLFHQFRSDLSGIGGGAFPDFEIGSEVLVLNTIELTITRGICHNGCFLVRPGDSPYYSQTGLHASFIALFAPSSISNLAEFFNLARDWVAGLTAVTVILFTLWAFREWGIIAALVTAALIGSSTWIVLFAKNLYWLLFLHILPFVCGFWLYRLKGGTRMSRRILFFVLIYGLILVKSLFGYEYLTNILGACCIPVIYYSVLNARRFLSLVSECALTCVCGVAGFVSAVGIHLIQGYLHFGSFATALEQVYLRAQVRTYQLPDDAIRDRGVMTFTQLVGKYLEQIAFSGYFGRREAWEMSLGTAILVVLIAAFGVLCLYWFGAVQRKLYALSLATLVALPVSGSWLIFGYGHSYVHIHLNCIVFFTPFFLTGFTLLGACAERSFYFFSARTG